MPTITTAGHVDHGKSSLVYALTGQDPDRLAEEKTRGLTIDLGFAWTELDLPNGGKMELAFVDVPGHEKFVGNMLAGAASVGACLFAISAKEGLKPQSWEHLHILDLFGIRDGVVALTNVEGISDEDLDKAQNEISNSLVGSFLENAEVLRTDAPAGRGIEELKVALGRLFQRLPESLDLNNPRFWVDRSFVISGSGTVVTATLTTGKVVVGDELLALPAGKMVKVRGIESMGKERKEVGPGTRVALNLTKITTQEIQRGNVLVKPDRWFLTKTFDASFSVPSKTPNKSIGKSISKLTEKGAYMIYLGSGDFRIRIAILGQSKSSSKSIGSGKTGKVRIFLESELPLKLGDTFVIRDVGRQLILGGGEILDLNPVLKTSKADPDLSVERILLERGGWLKTQELKLLTYPLLSDGPKTDESKKESSSYVSLGEWTILNSVRTQLQEELLRKIKGEKIKGKNSGVKTSELNEVELEILNGLILNKEVSIKRGRAHEGGSVDAVDHPYLKLLVQSQFSPPPPEGHIEKEQLRDFVYQKLVLEVEGIFYSMAAVVEAREVLAELLSKNSEGVSVSEFREALSTTRKYALSLLGYFDSVGVSRRRGNNRIEGPRIYEPL